VTALFSRDYLVRFLVACYWLRHACDSAISVIEKPFDRELKVLEPIFDLDTLAGILNKPAKAEPDVHIWIQSAQQWLQLFAGVSQFDRQPDDMSEVVTAVLQYRGSKNK